MASTPSFEQVIKQAIDLAVTELRVSLPGIVQRYDAQKQQADVQPVIMKKYTNGNVVKLPVITNVPVAHPRAGKTIIHVPIHVGDVVQLVFADRSLDRWLSEGGVVDPLEGRKHNLSDAVAYPGGYPFNDPVAIGDPDAVTIKNENAEVLVKADGTVSIKGNLINLGDHSLSKFVAIAELVKSEIDSFKSTFDSHTHPYVDTPIGPSVTSPPAVPSTPTGNIASSKVKVIE